MPLLLIKLLSLGRWLMTSSLGLLLACVAATYTAGDSASTPPAASSAPKSFRVATWNLGDFTDARLDRPRAVQLIGRVLSQFDLIAVRGIRTRKADALPRLVAAINSETGRTYDYVVGAPYGGDPPLQCAFIYDTSHLSLDRGVAQSLKASDAMPVAEPLLSRFVTKVEERPFSFVAVTAECPVSTASEVRRDVQRRVLAFCHERLLDDDLLWLGDFPSTGISELHDETTPVYRSAVAPVNPAATSTSGVILFDRKATREFTGLAGEYDFVGELRLTAAETRDVAEHRPIWVEFSIQEALPPLEATATAEPVQ